MLTEKDELKSFRTILFNLKKRHSLFCTDNSTTSYIPHPIINF